MPVFFANERMHELLRKNHQREGEAAYQNEILEVATFFFENTLVIKSSFKENICHFFFVI